VAFEEPGLATSLSRLLSFFPGNQPLFIPQTSHGLPLSAGMRRSLGPLLCELHAHTRWSDGALTVPELVDLHGRTGFDLVCVTDHGVRSDDPWRHEGGLLFSSVEEETFPRYLAEIEREAARAWRTYGLLVVPGLELTFNDAEPVMAAHAVAVGVRAFVSVD